MNAAVAPGVDVGFGSRNRPLRTALAPPVLVIVALFAASMLLEPVRETLSYGQINLVLCALILGDVLGLKHRGRGIGTALTSAVLAAGRDAGASIAVLTASPDGAGIYRRLGFAEQRVVRRFATGEAPPALG